jgi:GNAT superfamily N-acetyltransferase
MVQIRKLRAEDLPVVSDLICNTLLVSNLRDYDLQTILELSQSFSEQEIREMAARREFFLYEEEGQLAGVIGLEGTGVYDFFVPPDRQGRGVGRALLGFVEKLALRREIEELHLSSSLTAVGFYERLGYRRTGAENDGRLGRTVELVKSLQRPAAPPGRDGRP